MEKFNEVSRHLISRADAFLTCWGEEEGSEVAQAAGVAIAAAVLIGAIKTGAETLGNAVKTAFSNVANALQ